MNTRPARVVSTPGESQEESLRKASLAEPGCFIVPNLVFPFIRLQTRIHVFAGEPALLKR